MRYLPLTQTDRQAMLAKIGAASIDDLFVDVPEVARLDGPIHGLPMHAGEMAVERHMKALAAKNLVAGDVPFFLGAGAYRHHVPASVDTIIQRGEFLTAYTPYQPEIAQGTLQMLFEFQTQVVRLYGCAVANASLYDGSTACWEAVAMATRVTRRNRAVLSGALHPHYAQVVKTMAKFTGDTIADALPAITPDPELTGLIGRIDEDTACVVVQYPDILGRIADLLRSIEQMLVIEMSIPRCRLMIGMTEQPPDHGQGFLAHRGMAGEGMAQVVDAQFAKISTFKDRPPEMPDAGDRPAILVVPEQPGDLRIARQTVDDLARSRTEPDRAWAGLAVSQEQTVALHVLPLEGQDFAITAAGQQQQRDDSAARADSEIVTGAQFSKRFPEPGQFLRR
jgi:hypothetical protein